jgi:anti-sigma B factor antagonist
MAHVPSVGGALLPGLTGITDDRRKVRGKMLRLTCLACGLLLPYKESATNLCPRCLVSEQQAVSLIPVSDAPVSRATMGGLRVYTRVEGDRHTIFLTGELDVASAPVFEDALVESCSQGPKELVLDMAGVEFMDSSGLRAILDAKQKCEELECGFCVSPARRPVERTLEASGVRSRLAASKLGKRWGARLVAASVAPQR